MLELGLFMGAAFKELLDFEDFLGDLHHPEVVDLLGGLNGAPFQVLPEVDDHRME